MADPHKFKLTIEDLGNSSIEADVPETQVIRKPPTYIDEKFDDVYTPILKVTKNEVTLTKGSAKLQKVSVTEEELPSYLNPIYSEIQSEVIATQAVRERIAIFNEGSKKDNDSKLSKPKTRIPIKKFKETVNKVTKGRPNEENDDEKQVPSESKEKRTSSIPKLKMPPPKNNNKFESPSADEEFDKIFEDIIESNNVVEDNSIEDPVSLEHSFDELAQAYDENKLKPIEVLTVTLSTPVGAVTKSSEVKNDRNYSKIPLGRFKSVQEVKEPSYNFRRSSLKSEIDELMVTKDKQTGNKNVREIYKNKETNNKQVKAKHNELVRNILMKTNDRHAEGINGTSENAYLEPVFKNKNTAILKENYTANTNKMLKENIESTLNKNNINEGNEIFKNNGDIVQCISKNEIEHIELNKINQDDNIVPNEQSCEQEKYFIPTDRNIKVEIKQNETPFQPQPPTNDSKYDKVMQTENYSNSKPRTSLKNNSFYKHCGVPESYQNHQESKKMMTSESRLRLERLVNKFDDASYRDDRQKHTAIDIKNNAVNLCEFNKETEPVIKKEYEEVKNVADIEDVKDANLDSKSHENINLKKINVFSIRKLPIRRLKANKEEILRPITKDLAEHEHFEKVAKLEKSKTETKSQKNRTDGDNADIQNNMIEDNDVEIKAKMSKSKSVLSKIALFERKEATQPIRHRYPKQKYDEVSDAASPVIPKIVDEVLKTIILRQKSDKGDEIIVIKEESEDIGTISFEDHFNLTEVVTMEAVGEENNKENNDLVTIITDSKEHQFVNDNETFSKLKDNKIRKLSNDDNIELEKSAKNKHLHKSLENINKNSNDRSKLFKKEAKDDVYAKTLTRTRSLANIELGDALTGKVEFILKNINIQNEEETECKKEVISIRERPRKRSVADKIAIFEKKLVPIKIEDEIQTHHQNAIPDSEKQNRGDEKQRELDEDTKKKLEDLLTAKLRYKSIGTMPFIKLNDGVKMPVLALGTALLEPSLVKYIVGAAIDLGFRAIDTAYIYGNEKEVGEGIRNKIFDGTVKREDLFIMSKLWSTFHRPDLVDRACKNTLDALGLDYLDLFMIHNPMSFKEGSDPVPKIANVIQYSEYDFMDAWRAMEDLKRRGFVKSIGVSNFNAEQVDRILDKGRVLPVVNQVECQPYLLQRRLSEHCRSRTIQLSCYGVLGSKDTPAEFKSTGSTPALDDPIVKSVAQDLGVSSARVLIRYQLEKGHAVVAKSSSSAHLKDNLDALNMKLSRKEMEQLDSLNRNQRNFNFKGMGDTHKNYPFKKQF